MIAAELVGLWDSRPYDYGSMESSSLALLADGTGWSTWQNAAGAMSVSRFTWSCPEIATLELRYTTVISGTWEPGNPALARVDEQEPDDTVLRTTYTIRQDTTVMAADPFTALNLADPIEFTCKYGLQTREVQAADDPTATSTNSP
jgi:hypothetical protein